MSTIGSLAAIADYTLRTIMDWRTRGASPLNPGVYRGSKGVSPLDEKVSKRLASANGKGKTWVTNLEKVVAAVATELFQVEFKKVRPKWLKNAASTASTAGNLELDLYCPSIGRPGGGGLAIEVQGRQHYGPVHFGGGGGGSSHAMTAKSLFEKQKQRDHVKRFICHQRNIILIEVPYNIKRAEIASYLWSEYLKGIGGKHP